MDLNIYLLYLTSVLVLTASPGPSILLCVTKSISHGFRASVFAAIGSLTAIVGIMTLSFTGLGVLIASSEFAFNTVKLLGAAYLIYLGVRLLLSKAGAIAVDRSQATGEQLPKRALFFSGFLVGATNPKAIVFFTALFPQFINTQQALLPQYLLLVLTFAVLELSWLLLYAYFGAKSSSWLLTEERVNVFNKVTGGVFVGAGLFLSTSRHTA